MDTSDSTVREFDLDASRMIVTSQQLRDGALDLSASLLVCFQNYGNCETRFDLRVLGDWHRTWEAKMKISVSTISWWHKVRYLCMVLGAQAAAISRTAWWLTCSAGGSLHLDDVTRQRGHYYVNRGTE